MKFFEVVWIWDRVTQPQKYKMQVCIDFDEGWFLRIYTWDIIRPCVPIPKSLNTYLKHDSHVDCSIHEIDETVIDDALRENGIAGQVHLSHAPEILTALLKATFIPSRDKDRLRLLFDPFC